MNTRLQVEHRSPRWSPASTWCTRSCGSRPASRCRGRRQALSQRGHAIECRIYAEDPAQGFLPQAGPLLLYREPQGPGIRVDSGVAEGGEVSVHYDPMLAKLIVLGRHARGGTTPRRRRLAPLPRARHPHQHPVPDRAARASAVRRRRASTPASSIARATRCAQRMAPDLPRGGACRGRRASSDRCDLASRAAAGAEPAPDPFDDARRVARPMSHGHASARRSAVTARRGRQRRGAH